MGLSRRQILWTTLALVVAGLVVAIATAVIVSAVTSSNIRGTQVDNTATIDSSAQTLKIIQDCTTPSSRCYERGQRQLRSAITDINRVSIIAAACASGPTEVSVQDIQACVIRRLATKP